MLSFLRHHLLWLGKTDLFTALHNEYNVEIRMDQLPYEHVRWIENEDIDVNSLSLTSDAKRVKDFKERPLLLFTHPWSIQTVLDRNEGLILSEVSQNNE